MARTSGADLRSRISGLEPPRDFAAAVTAGRRRAVAAIAEVKRQSPSAGLIRPEYAGDGFDPAAIARGYSEYGASAVSCLTDRTYFGGSPSYIQRIREVIDLPVLRKDFILDPWQVLESRAMGADAVLLIAECLGENEMKTLGGLSQELGMSVLIEAHTSANLTRAIAAGRALGGQGWLLGVNNRDLGSMRTDLGHTLRLVEEGAVPADLLGRLVSESGIASSADLGRLAGAGVGIVLVGEHLMRQPDPGRALGALLEGSTGAAPGKG